MALYALLFILYVIIVYWTLCLKNQLKECKIKIEKNKEIIDDLEKEIKELKKRNEQLKEDVLVYKEIAISSNCKCFN